MKNLYHLRTFRTVRPRGDVCSSIHSPDEEGAVVEALNLVERTLDCGSIGAMVYKGAELTATLTVDVDERDRYILVEVFRDTRYQTTWTFFYRDDSEALEAATQHFLPRQGHLKCIGVWKYRKGRKVYAHQVTAKELSASYDLVGTIS